ncbi:hypothetical protein ATANTOWER_010716 [Ataeniobius toweri]|uniref:Uncharacterized protein n=1 Tax=Ataeniobius toweri TaxID=208326 RepID=A0ABU7C136_9TELE|nr:hypothetical protein [Ataeniobius toweri]
MRRRDLVYTGCGKACGMWLQGVFVVPWKGSAHIPTCSCTQFEILYPNPAPEGCVDPNRNLELQSESGVDRTSKRGMGKMGRWRMLRHGMVITDRKEGWLEKRERRGMSYCEEYEEVGVAL